MPEGAQKRGYKSFAQHTFRCPARGLGLDTGEKNIRPTRPPLPHRVDLRHHNSLLNSLLNRHQRHLNGLLHGHGITLRP